jgi:hypothetical protein
MKAKIQAFLGKLWGEIVDTWERIKVYVLAALALVLALEFRKFYTSFLVWLGQRQLNSAKKTDAPLAVQESKESQEADALVKQAEDLPKTEQPVTEDWYKNQ